MNAKAFVWCPFYFERGICMEKKMQYKIAWKVNKYRRDKRTGPLTPVPRSKYAQLLFEEGAGWNEEKPR